MQRETNSKENTFKINRKENNEYENYYEFLRRIV